MFWNSRKSLDNKVSTVSNNVKSVEPESIVIEPDNFVPPKPKEKVFKQADSLKGINNQHTTEEPFGIILENETVEGSGIYFEYNIPALSVNEKQLILAVRGGEVTVIGIPSTQFSPELYIFANGVAGYLDQTGAGTEKIAILRARQIVPNEHAGITYYTVIYSVMDCEEWDIGLQRVLSIGVGDTTGRYFGKLPSKIMLEFKVLHLQY